jgi:hypothetical protein
MFNFTIGFTTVISNQSDSGGYTITTLYGQIWTTFDSFLSISKKPSSLSETS